MKKNYIYTTFFFLLFSLAVTAQENKDSSLIGKTQEQPLDNLNIYPNPVTTGKLYISSKSNNPKEIEIFDVLGKRVMQHNLTSKELNISNLTPGVYIIKIKEAEQRATRKFIIK
ncbi:T9SS type A sorting domain-containing protein [Flavobacterium sp. H122]|uniref:T9SS type A sorting domain-containing protein n=1 Tax=Flavobacterium sp. H122 TaxID=2529860 RepID=UPI0010AA1E53|nr:T9SS type A sorting domain-containing protein [Flavobacterium sp. H122]